MKHNNNRHIQDKRHGATSRAEELRQQILRGSQEATVVRGRPAFQRRELEGYTEVDRLQPEGGGGQPPLLLGPVGPDEKESESGSEAASPVKLVQPKTRAARRSTGASESSDDADGRSRTPRAAAASKPGSLAGRARRAGLVSRS
eukprot:TRINITY_DN20809_c0_g1_i3.p1 TRINITY_DN20809_c0_g1~~TRINITY_DN20809_c0_g1_i3.p1  ORF type:complete len:145 (+),score=26.18 TRINITY_DN20809_c0_g1_i3:47-481(+)